MQNFFQIFLAFYSEHCELLSNKFEILFLENFFIKHFLPNSLQCFGTFPIVWNILGNIFSTEHYEMFPNKFGMFKNISNTAKLVAKHFGQLSITLSIVLEQVWIYFRNNFKNVLRIVFGNFLGNHFHGILWNVSNQIENVQEHLKTAKFDFRTFLVFYFRTLLIILEQI